MYGEGGNDDIIATGNGNDWIDGGIGDDILSGSQEGQIIYVVNEYEGNDAIYTQGGYDILEFGENIELSDLSFSRSNYHLLVTNNVTGQVTQLSNVYYQGAVNYEVEELRFADGSSYDGLFLTARGSSYFGTNGNEVISEWMTGGAKISAFLGNGDATYRI